MPALSTSSVQCRGLAADVLSGVATLVPLVSDVNNSSRVAAVSGPPGSLAGPTQTPAPTPPPVTVPPLATPATGPGAAPPATPIAVSGAVTPSAPSPPPDLTQDNDGHTKKGNSSDKGTDTSSQNPSSTASVSATSNSENSGNGAVGTATVSSTPTSSAVDGTTTDTADAASPSFSSTAGAVSPFSSSTFAAVSPSSSTSGTDSASSSSTPDFVASSSTVSSIVFPSVSALNNSPSAQSTTGQDNTQLKTKHQSHGGEIAGGVVGGLIFLLLLGAGVLCFMRRRHRHTAPSAEFLTVFPPATPFRQESFRVAATKQYGTVGGAGAPPMPFSVDMEKHPGVSTPSVFTMTTCYP